MGDSKSEDLTGQEIMAEEREDKTDVKRVRKPTIKVIENQIQQGRLELENQWKKVKISIEKLKQTPDIVEQIRQEITSLRAAFGEYENIHYNLVDFMTENKSPDCKDELETVDTLLKNRKDYVVSALADAATRKNDILQEMSSVHSRSSSHSRVSARSSLRSQAKADAVAAKKRAEMNKKITQAEKESKRKIDELEKMLKEQQDKIEKVKIEEENRMRELRCDEEIEVANARLRAIEEDECFQEEFERSLKPFELPEIDSKERVLNFLDHIPDQNVAREQDIEGPTSGLPVPQEPQSNDTRKPRASSELPVPQGSQVDASRKTSFSEQNIIESCLQFMARRELISNKVEKFDDSPQNFRSWKASFKNMIKDVNVTPSEELSLILEHTTGQSKRLVQSLRNAYIENPEDGVKETWKRLTERFGSDAVVTKVQMEKLNAFPKIATKDNQGLQDLGDLLLEIECAKKAEGHTGLGILDEPAYLRPIVEKLPDDIQGRWQSEAYRYKVKNEVNYPPFSELSRFVQEIAKERNDPYLKIEKAEKQKATEKSWDSTARRKVTNMKTEILSETPEEPRRWCCLHKRPHPLTKCRLFLAKSSEEQRKVLKHERICFRCASTRQHLTKDCTETLYCMECQSDSHITAFHPQSFHVDVNAEGNEAKAPTEDAVKIISSEVCDEVKGSSSCCKILPAYVYKASAPQKKIKVYTVIDDQSNHSLAKTRLFDELGENGPPVLYSLSTCTGMSERSGRRASGLIIESVNGKINYKLPTVTECDSIPDSKEEIPTPDAAKKHAHFKEIANEIPAFDPSTEVLLLVGRDAPELHKVRESRNGPKDAPWAQRLDLGWVVIGDTCLDGAHKPRDVSSCLTQVLFNGRPSHLLPCPNRLHVKQHLSCSTTRDGDKTNGMFVDGKFADGFGKNIFTTTKEDNKTGFSIEDKRFIYIMEKGMEKGDEGNWVSPLPFRKPIGELPNSREPAMRRLMSTLRNLEKKPQMKEHYFTFMQKLLESGNAEIVPPDTVDTSTPCWYLPHFGVYHPQKPSKVRVVYDAAAQCHGISLNSLLLSGPDLTNNLLGILLRFREGNVAFMADVEQMFYSFLVQEDHRDFLRFLWFKGNNPDNEIVDYRMKVHIFGSTSSPAVATYGLRKTAELEGATYGQDAARLVNDNFYVDDALKSVATDEEAIDLLQRTQDMLATANLRLHKIVSNSPNVMEAFPSKDQAVDLRDLDFSKDMVPTQRSLGVSWDVKDDTFTFKVTVEEKPFTRRGVLSVVNSLYDPLGLIAPVTIRGKSLLRNMTTSLQPKDWDEPLPDEHKKPWEAWRASLQALNDTKVPRAYSSRDFNCAVKKEIHTFGDASNEAIAAVSYLRILWPDGQVDVSFLLGKAKLAPIRATTIPRLELCAAVLATEITVFAVEELEFTPDAIVYYTDSRVVLGYILNEKRRFYVYVTNRVEQIRKNSDVSQWQYVPTNVNPADIATRSVSASGLSATSWHQGPDFLHLKDPPAPALEVETLQNDPEVQASITVKTTKVKKQDHLGTARFSRFSQWSSLLRGMAKLVTVARTISYLKRASVKEKLSLRDALQRAEMIVLKSIQWNAYGEELKCLHSGKPIPRSSPLAELNPLLDEEGLIVVGGRLEEANLTNRERHPIILPSSSHVTELLVKHLHSKVQHQGQHFTLGVIRSSGFWIVGVRRLVRQIISNCLKCRKLRRPQHHQLMASLPKERVNPSPPFTYVGLDVFGPWEVVARRTRGGLANSKRWAVIFTCLSTRAIHIEVIESMDTSSFINSLRRFLALRGPVTQLRSDCGTNFVGAHNEFQRQVESYLADENCEWVFNPPHASHAGGVWERMIGVVRRVLDAVLSPSTTKHLTHEVLITLMAEVSAIVNGRPLVPVSSDPTSPEILTPATILTLKPKVLKAPPVEFKDESLSGKQWRVVQQLANSFWSKWKREYIHLLQTRKKWCKELPNLEVGDLVLLRDKDAPRNCWPMSRITQVIPSKDGKVRQVEVMTAVGGVRKTYRRPTTELVLLAKRH